MIEKKIVEKLVEEALNENQELFLIELNILPDNKITVVVDGDNGITIKECIRISRHIEHNLDREEYDFALDVTSPGLSEPLLKIRQYKKNLGRTLKIKTDSETYEGKLTRVDDKEIEIEWKVREPKPIGKGKVTVLKKETLPFEIIKQTKVKLIF
ncbi:MAG: ribosome assembly cofactor RimP [Aureibaculum sp.]